MTAQTTTRQLAVVVVDVREDFSIAGLDRPTQTPAYAAWEAADDDDWSPMYAMQAADEAMFAAALAQFTAGAQAAADEFGVDLEVVSAGADGELADRAARRNEAEEDVTRMIWQAGQDAITARALPDGTWSA